MDRAISLLLVGDDGMFPGGLEASLGSGSGIEVVGRAGGADEAATLCRTAPPDVVLLDLDLPGIDGSEATRSILEAAPEAKVIVVTELQSPESIAFALASGACGFIPRMEAPGDLEGILRRAADGEMVMPVNELGAVVGQLNGRRSGRPGVEDAIARLTARETQILTALAQGDSTLEIAERLGISRLTVQSHVKSILAKLGVHSKVEAVTLAWRHGLAPISRTA